MNNLLKQGKWTKLNFISFQANQIYKKKTTVSSCLLKYNRLNNIVLYDFCQDSIERFAWTHCLAS